MSGKTRYTFIKGKAELSVEVIGDGYTVTVISATSRSLSSPRAKTCEIRPFDIEVTKISGTVLKDKLMFFREDAVWDDIIEQVKSNRLMIDTPSRDDVKGKVDELNEHNLRLAGILSADKEYQEEARKNGDLGFHKATEIYMLSFPEKYEVTKEEMHTFLKLATRIKDSKGPSHDTVKRYCRDVAQKKPETFPTLVHQQRKVAEKTTREAQRQRKAAEEGRA